jgi:hypothetical protein
MTAESEFAAALAGALGPLFRVSVTDREGAVVAAFGHIEGSRTARSTIPFPNSPRRLVLEVDVQALETAAGVIGSLAAPHQPAETSIGPIANLDDALERLIAHGEAHLGTPLAEMTRTEKQQLVKFLDERGAFTLRKSVETVADRLGVSRFTVYNYLDAVRAP